MQATKILQALKDDNNLRTLQDIQHDGIYIIKDNKRLLNLSSNDYLGIATDRELREEFFDTIDKESLLLGSTSSRSLSGNYRIFTQLEDYIAAQFSNKSCLLFNSGYHLNISCMQALSEFSNVLFVVDKFVHASIIDGLRLGGKRFMRYTHNDMQSLASILEKTHNQYESIIIVSEGLFSMDGDLAQLDSLCAFKQQYSNVMLYLDEAHSVGVFGENGLGLASLGYENSIDFLVYTFGKAIGSFGACMICSPHLKDFFINKARGFIYSTAIAPINVAWNLFVFQKLKSMQNRRKHLLNLSELLRKECAKYNISLMGEAQILSLIAHTNENALLLADKLSHKGFFAPAIKTPSVPPNTARLRISLTSNMQEEMMIEIVSALNVDRII
ncbi:aminotransferase class I/II-fold pyridoxal phosphate-dependent enzyme [Helicobacter bilis]|uniref:8-amino-7-oxononanoate synthase n=1 Tax=Helicobacter bilis TaxID=37372 RepID=A0A4U8UC65_9HELI|nr:8-amino-7-oxononanoate synthase [Helicobacter bilis]MCI7411655.1 8-amino-7-oxononanoate synthase [Helicobacter bilis]MDD7296686.1 8-amino-7-oxononanoate synthase [Helicobacter bilis]MDY4400012.1 8-amino-7-oxononanoate synthase [Helicobacter bilis]TLE08519.1 8-amino-7-oxononanoate synthase [Helicobacter bilis]TLE10561.1 8-amino-7-oxononanoate synthase [Helicobacter bilis]